MTVRAVEVRAHGGYEQLRLVERDRPVAGGDRAVLRVLAAGVNPVDDEVRAGRMPYAAPPPLVPGREGVAVVDDPGGTDLVVGDRVLLWRGGWGITVDGAWQDFVVGRPSELVPAPATLSDAEAAVASLAPLTAQLALTTGGFAAGSSVLVPAAGGAVGSAAVQLAVAQGARLVITTVGSTAKAGRVRARGLPTGVHLVDLSCDDLAAAVADLTGGAGVDLCVDSVGGAVTAAAVPSLRIGGRLVCVGFAGGASAAIDLRALVYRGITLVGFSIPGARVADPDGYTRAVATVLRLLDEGEVRPVVDRVLPLEEAAEAQRYAAQARPTGRVVLSTGAR